MYYLRRSEFVRSETFLNVYSICFLEEVSNSIFEPIEVFKIRKNVFLKYFSAPIEDLMSMPSKSMSKSLSSLSSVKFSLLDSDKD